jgi:predicted acylesterase/phospholipase RssA
LSTREPAVASSSRSRAAARRPGKTALVLAGGGVTGGIYQVGVLRALDDILLDRSVVDFDLYVGTSAGAFVATLLAVGIPPRALAEAARSPSLGLQWRMIRHVFSPNIGEIGSRLRALPRRLPAVLSDLVRHRGSFLLSDLVGFASLALPTGILDSRQLGNFMRDILTLAEVPTEFDRLRSDLYLVACDIDTWQRVVFSRDTRPAVSIPDAVAASSAVPILFRPVQINGASYIDGGAKGTAAIDVAIDHGASLVVVVNPLVPLDVRGIRRSTELHRFGESIVDLGIRGIYNQLARGIVHDGLADHVRVLRQRHPEVDIVLIEPRPDDEKMFFHEVMSTSARLVVAQHGYESVLEGLSHNLKHFATVMRRHGLEISPGILDGRPWQVPVKALEAGDLPEQLQKTVFRRGGHESPESRRFERVMDRIEAELDTGRAPARAHRRRQPAHQKTTTQPAAARRPRKVSTR